MGIKEIFGFGRKSEEKNGSGVENHSGREKGSLPELEVIMKKLEITGLARLNVILTLSKIRTEKGEAAEKRALIELKIKGFEYFQERYVDDVSIAPVKIDTEEVPQRISMILDLAQGKATVARATFSDATSRLRAEMDELSSNKNGNGGSGK